MLRRLPSTVSDRDGALAEPLAVALRAIRLSGAAPDEPVCVLGVGPIGLLAVVIDSTGHPSGAPLALRLLPAAGRLTVVGLPDDPAALDLGLLAFKEITVRGSLVYDEHDFAAAVAHIAAGRIPCDRIITRVAPLDSAPAIVAELRGGATDHVKVLLTPGERT
jgi:threonine dehydrogenase-like Zn-dependent dehydrogenase